MTSKHKITTVSEAFFNATAFERMSDQIAGWPDWRIKTTMLKMEIAERYTNRAPTFRASRLIDAVTILEQRMAGRKIKPVQVPYKDMHVIRNLMTMIGVTG